MNYQIPDLKKFKCRNGQCQAPLPEVYCERVMIMRREIPHFINLLDALGNDVVLSYHILPPQRESDSDDRSLDRTWIIIWVDPRKHYDPEFLVKAAANIACGIFTLQEEVDYITRERNYESYHQRCREVNCPECVKNHLQNCTRAMSYEQYVRSLAAAAGIHDE